MKFLSIILFGFFSFNIVAVPLEKTTIYCLKNEVFPGDLDGALRIIELFDALETFQTDDAEIFTFFRSLEGQRLRTFKRVLERLRPQLNEALELSKTGGIQFMELQLGDMSYYHSSRYLEAIALIQAAQKLKSGTREALRQEFLNGVAVLDSSFLGLLNDNSQPDQALVRERLEQFNCRVSEIEGLLNELLSEKGAADAESPLNREQVCAKAFEFLNTKQTEPESIALADQYFTYLSKYGDSAVKGKLKDTENMDQIKSYRDQRSMLFVKRALLRLRTNETKDPAGDFEIIFQRGTKDDRNELRNFLMNSATVRDQIQGKLEEKFKREQSFLYLPDLRKYAIRFQFLDAGWKYQLLCEKYFENNKELAKNAFEELKRFQLQKNEQPEGFGVPEEQGLYFLRIAAQAIVDNLSEADAVYAYLNSSGGAMSENETSGRLKGVFLRLALIEQRYIPGYDVYKSWIQEKKLPKLTDAQKIAVQNKAHNQKRVRIKYPGGSYKEVRMVPVPGDGDCLFTSLGITRADFIRRVREAYKKGNTELDELVDLMMVADRNADDLNAWVDAFSRSTMWGGQAQMPLISRFYNIRIHVLEEFEGEQNTYRPVAGSEVIDFTQGATQQPVERYVVWNGVHYNRIVSDAISSPPTFQSNSASARPVGAISFPPTSQSNSASAPSAVDDRDVSSVNAEDGSNIDVSSVNAEDESNRDDDTCRVRAQYESTNPSDRTLGGRSGDSSQHAASARPVDANQMPSTFQSNFASARPVGAISFPPTSQSNSASAQPAASAGTQRLDLNARRQGESDEEYTQRMQMANAAASRAMRGAPAASTARR